MKPARRLGQRSGLGDVRLIRRLSGGWNETWLAARGHERLMVRFDTPAVRRLGLDRAAEAAVLRSIQGRGLGPEPVFVDPRRGVLVTRWLPGRALAPAGLRNPQLLRHLGAMLRRLHETARPPSGIAPLDLAHSADRYALLAGNAGARRLARAARRSLKAAAGRRREPALCHNDLVAQNILRGPALRLIDWEFASPGDPLFDLAVVLGHHDLGNGHARTLLAAARGRAHPSDFRSLAHLVDCYANMRLLWEAAVRAVTQRPLPAKRVPATGAD
ncbi:MAG: phosphotransferase family protein [Gammaproteobacteria bacterium]|nr:phosphotransferase family protein [Gammaproteobacteria bacterium]